MAARLCGGKAALLVLMLAGSQACGNEEPVLLGVSPEQREREQRQQEREGVWQRNIPESATRDAPSGQPVAYEKPEGVYVDLHWLGGRRYDDAAEQLQAQLGALAERREIDTRRGEELVYERGVARVVRGTVYMVRVDLPEPMTRTDALLVTGFSIYADHWRETHLEYRLANSWGFERFRLQRAEPGGDRVVSVEAWKLRPERVQR